MAIIQITKRRAFRWSFFHCVIAVNEWQAHLSSTLDVRCLGSHNAIEFQVHEFYHCPFTLWAWWWASNVIYHLKATPSNQGPWYVFSMRKYLFDDHLPARSRNFKSKWPLICSFVLWIVWKARNAIVFNNEKWVDNHLYQLLWDNLLDYGRSHWQKLRIAYLKALDMAKPSFFDKFDKS